MVETYSRPIHCNKACSLWWGDDNIFNTCRWQVESDRRVCLDLEQGDCVATRCFWRCRPEKAVHVTNVIRHLRPQEASPCSIEFPTISVAHTLRETYHTFNMEPNKWKLGKCFFPFVQFLVPSSLYQRCTYLNMMFAWYLWRNGWFPWN